MIYLYRCLRCQATAEVQRPVAERHHALFCGLCGGNMVLEVQPVPGRVDKPAVGKRR